jgi:hypothetical protein
MLFLLYKRLASANKELRLGALCNGQSFPGDAWVLSTFLILYSSWPADIR